MEMHQVRYFLAVARLLNFTRAAEECHVAQPSLTRAIKQLEQELGGELFRRERNLTHLTELGHRMVPLMQQCHDSAQSAKQLASSLKKGAIAPLTIALALSINVALVLPFLRELVRAFSGLALSFVRLADVVDALQNGEAELAIAGTLATNWDRIESWALFAEPYRLAVDETHPLASSSTASTADLGKERILFRSYCEGAPLITDFLSHGGIDPGLTHSVDSDEDFMALLAGRLGVGVAPMSSAYRDTIKMVPVEGLEAKRTVYIHAVSGRQRSTAGNTLIKMMRAADWHQFDL